jgi:ribosomal protein L11 methyltransferase
VIRLAVRVHRADAERVLAELLELAPSGVEEVELAPDTVEYAVYGASGELPDLPDVRAATGEALVEVSSSEVADDWGERWKRFHKPVMLESPAPESVPGIWVRPPWESPADLEGTVEIVIDPGQAFGTGAHATTRLCLELLLELIALEGRLGPLMDVGTGSGVLAIAAARLGFAPVLGLDHERESVAAARKNAQVNGARIEVRRFDLRAQTLPWLDRETGPEGSLVVVANLLRPLLLDLAREMPSPPAHLLAGGLLKEQVDEVAQAFSERLGMRERERRESGEWAAVWLTALGGDDQAGSATSVAARTIAR